MTTLLTLSPPDNAQEWCKSLGFASLRDASRFAGGQGKKSLDALSSPGKMPCHSYGLPAAECITGSKMRAADDARYLAAYELAREAGKSHRAAHAIAKDTVENTCGGCYALKGQYVIGNVPAAQYRRLESLSDPRWTDAMVCLIGWSSRVSRVFRWHDSGDLQSVEHLLRIVEIADRLPWVTFWIPTREAQFVLRFLREYGPFPANLTVRQSVAKIGHMPNPASARDGRMLSGVAFPGQDVPEELWSCPAYRQDGMCGDCRACWSQDVPVVIYPLH